MNKEEDNLKNGTEKEFLNLRVRRSVNMKSNHQKGGFILLLEVNQGDRWVKRIFKERRKNKL